MEPPAFMRGNSALQATPICGDLFELSDGSRNLQTIYTAKGAEIAEDDPEPKIRGTFSYLVRISVTPKYKLQ